VHGWLSSEERMPAGMFCNRVGRGILGGVDVQREVDKSFFFFLLSDVLGREDSSLGYLTALA
jgi:hypothetical protein